MTPDNPRESSEIPPIGMRVEWEASVNGSRFRGRVRGHIRYCGRPALDMEIEPGGGTAIVYPDQLIRQRPLRDGAMSDAELAPLQPFEQLRDEYAAITIDDDSSRFGEVQERFRQALAAVGWSWPEDECWLPRRCPGREYCTQFLEGAQTEPCGWWPNSAAVGQQEGHTS